MVSHFPVFQILLQIEVGMSMMASPPALSNSAGVLSTPTDFPIFSACVLAIFKLKIVLSDSMSILHMIIDCRLLTGQLSNRTCAPF